MWLPSIRGVIDRRVLVNFRIDADAAARVLPAPFRPKVVRGYAIAGICLIRLKHVRPAWLPAPLGIRSENAAHRFAVEWDTPTGVGQGVYIPRRDTNSRLNTFAGGRLFPGVHHHARFTVDEPDDRVSISLDSDDGDTHVSVVGRVADRLPASSVFESPAGASAFFESGSLGYSATPAGDRFDGLELRCFNWSVTPLDIESVASSYFDDARKFPAGSVAFDHALLMRGIEHEWVGRGAMCCGLPAATAIT